MAERSNPNVKFSEDKHTSAKPVPSLQGGGRKEKKDLLFTHVLWGRKMSVSEQSQMLNSTSSSPILADTEYLFFCTFYFVASENKTKPKKSQP